MNTSTRLLRILAFVVLALATRSTPSMAGPATYASMQPDQFLSRWLVAGPIPAHAADDPKTEAAARKSGFEADLLVKQGGESAVEPQGGTAIKVRHAEYRWQEVDSKDEAVDLSQLLGAGDGVVGYASATVMVADETKTILAIGSDDAVRVWLNGELVHDHWTSRSLGSDDDLVSVTLNKGANHLLLKVFNGVGDWSFTCRFLSDEAQAEKLVGAASQGDDAKIRLLLEQGVDVNAKAKHGVTAIQAARISGFPHIAALLESKGANSNDGFSAEQFVDRVLSDWTSAEGPGVCVLVSKDGEVLFRKGYGLANIEHDVPVTNKTKFRVGSVTKQFAASAILKLQEEGKLSVDNALSKYVPDFPRGDEVKIRHLLTHTSGIHSFTSDPDFYANVTSAATNEEMIDSFKEDEFDFAPGAEWRYNNSGYFLLGYIIEKVSGQSFGDYLKETFFEPLGMRDTGVHTSTAILKHEATGYSQEGDATSKALDWDMSRAGAAGNLYSTVDDLQRWNEAVFGDKVLGKESLEAAFTPVKLKNGEQPAPSYGFGWMIDEHRGLKRIAHSGGLHGFLANLVRYPEQGVTIVVFRNSSPTIPKLSPVAVTDLLANAYLWAAMAPRPRHEVAKDIDPTTYDAYIGRYAYGPGAVMTITREGKRIFAQLTNQAKYEIFPAGKSKFFWKVVDAQVEFMRDKDDQVVAARHTQSGRTFDAPKLKEEKTVKVSNEILDTYVGKYRYKGLGVLTVRRKDNQLLAQMTGQTEFEIYPKSETEFFWKVVPAEIRFVKNEGGKVEKAIHQQGGGSIEAPKIE